MPAWCSRCPVRTSALSVLENESPRESRLPKKSRNPKPSQFLSSQGKQIPGRCLQIKAIQMSSVACYTTPKTQSTQVIYNVTRKQLMKRVVEISDSQRASSSRTQTSPSSKMAVKSSWTQCQRINQNASFIIFETAIIFQNNLRMKPSTTRQNLIDSFKMVVTVRYTTGLRSRTIPLRIYSWIRSSK